MTYPMNRNSSVVIQLASIKWHKSHDDGDDDVMVSIIN